MMTRLLVLLGFISVGMMGAILVQPFFKDANPIRIILDKFSRLGWVNKIAILFIVVQLTMFGGAKHGGTNDVDDVTSTNDVELVEGDSDTNEELRIESGELMMGQTLMSSTLHSSFLTLNSQSAAPYRLESVSTNEGYSYAMPADGTLRGTWHLTGAYEDVQKVALDGFAFPLGSDLCTSLWAYTWGKVRPQLKNASNEIAAVGAPMSAIPDVSRFWTAATSNDTYLLTWENFAAGRLPAPVREDADGTVNAQIELFRNGDFITRSNDVKCVYRRVIEPNPIVDPINPPDPDDPTKPLYPYGPVQDLSVIEVTNAYCWVDIVVNAADAWVRFEGDGASNLADPSFAAKAGETNHVVILIGKTYKVTCDMPFTVVGKSDPSIDEWWEDGNTLWLNWPVQIEAWDGNGDSFMMHVVPNCLGGEFSWTNSCCAVSGSGVHFSYGCDGFCLCGGCSARGYYGYEGYRIGCSGGSCGCSWYDDDDRRGEDDPDDPEPTPGVSVSFSKSAVIFEDEYTNMPGQVVQWQSTTTKLTLEAHGGMKGGTATFTFTNKEKLIGPDIPTSITVPAGHCKTYEFTYRGNLPSGSEEDITVHGEFHENNPEAGSQPLTSDDELTSVKVKLEAAHTAVENPNANRHVFGVGEDAVLKISPLLDLVDVSSSLGLLEDLHGGQARYKAPAEGGTVVFTVSYGNVQKETTVDVFEPEGYVVHSIAASFESMPNEAGMIDLNFINRLYPLEVSFYAVEVTEIAMVSTDAVGYFAQPEHADDLDHGKRGAYGQWSVINEDNSTDDLVHFGRCAKPWNGGGSFTWPIPNAWRVAGDSCSTNVFTHTDQRFELDANGTARVSKFGWTGERGTNDTHRVYGE